MAYRANSGTEQLPLLPASLLGPEANEQEWADALPIDKLPALPQRMCGYYIEPVCGLSVVFLVSILLLSVSSQPQLEYQSGAVKAIEPRTVQMLIGSQVAAAAMCVLYLLFGDNGEVRRSARTCYPIPRPVLDQLAENKSCESMRNISGPAGRTYCVRCLVWRPGEQEGGPGHHCSICQRCVVGFDHHCGVFGRCITTANLPCFYTLIVLLFTGIITSGFAHALTETAVVLAHDANVTTITAGPSPRILHI